MIRLRDLLTEYSDIQKKQMGIPKDAISKGGKWYVGDKYVGKVVNNKFVPVKQKPAANKSDMVGRGKTLSKPIPKKSSKTKSVVIKSTNARKSVENAMKSNGYEKIGKGVYSVAFVKDQGNVVKIIVPQHSPFYGQDKESGEKIIDNFYEYCKKNKNNPHIVKMHGKKKFKVNDETYTHLSMEKLEKLTERQKDLVYDMNRSIETGEELKHKLTDSEQRFYDTMKDVIEVGNSMGHSNDIVNDSGINVMRRGTDLVILDPWA